MTEEEAKTKTCWRTLAPVLNYGPAACIASACMAWRWVEVLEKLRDSAYPLPQGNPKGFCGLAGAPQ